jgi:hypothetical protein
MNSKRLYCVLLGVIGLLGIAGIAGVAYGNSLLKRKTEQLTAVKTESVALDQQQRALIQAKKDIEKYSELEIIAKSVVPQEKDQARTVREIIKLAEDEDVLIDAITFPSSSLGTAAPKPATPAPTDGTTAPATATPAAPTTTQVKAVDGIPGLYQMEVNVTGRASQQLTYERLLAFLQRLEKSRRTSQVSSITINPQPSQRNLVSFNLIINIYLKPTNN